jgi:hypothetical protein
MAEPAAASSLHGVDDAGRDRAGEDGRDARRVRHHSEGSGDWLFWLVEPFGTAIGWMAERIVHAGEAVAKALTRKRRPDS